MRTTFSKHDPVKLLIWRGVSSICPWWRVLMNALEVSSSSRPPGRCGRARAPDGSRSVRRNPHARGYDNQGNLTQVTDPKGLNTSYSYNGFGELIFPRFIGHIYDVDKGVRHE